MNAASQPQPATPRSPSAAQRQGQGWTSGAVVLSFPQRNHSNGPRVKPLASIQAPVSPAIASDDPVWGSWLAATASGDAHAFEAFYNCSLRYALAVVRRIVGDNHADDVLADAYFQAWRDASHYDSSRGSPLAWFLTIARSRALDRLRAEQLRHGGLTGAPQDCEQDHADPAPGPDILLEHTQASSQLHGLLTQLSANERWVLGLAYYRELSHGDIARETGLALGTVKSLLHRAQQKLRAALQAAAPECAETASSPRSASGKRSAAPIAGGIHVL
jgi:RNA polymerase sigma-70 factor, ECF subfamily